jgi:hypothetical protein
LLRRSFATLVGRRVPIVPVILALFFGDRLIFTFEEFHPRRGATINVKIIPIAAE